MWFDPGRGGAKPENLPAEKPPETPASPLSLGPNEESLQGELSLASLVPAGGGCPWKESYPVSLSSKSIDSTPSRSRIQGLRGRLGRGEKGCVERTPSEEIASLLVGFSCSLSFPVMAVGEGPPSRGASASFPFPSGDLLGAQAQARVPPDVQRQGSCDQPLGLSPLGIPKEWKGLLLALAFRGGNPKSPPLHLDGASWLWESGCIPTEG